MSSPKDYAGLSSLKRLTIVATYDGLFGWRARLTHQHEGEETGCPCKHSYEGLALTELIDVAISHLMEANSAYSWDSTDATCHPAGTPGSVGDALKLRPR